MGVYKHIRNLWKQPKKNLGELWKQRLILWRREPATVKVKHSTRIDRARSLGYKAKQGVFIVRQRVKRGGHRRETYRGGKRTKRMGVNLPLRKSYQIIAEERAQRKYPNCEVLNSYFVAKDGIYSWYEIIMVDRAHPSVLASKELRNVVLEKGRVHRGLTSAGRKSRGMRHKGRGAEKIRKKK